MVARCCGTRPRRRARATGAWPGGAAGHPAGDGAGGAAERAGRLWPGVPAPLVPPTYGPGVPAPPGPTTYNPAIAPPPGPGGPMTTPMAPPARRGFNPLWLISVGGLGAVVLACVACVALFIVLPSSSSATPTPDIFGIDFPTATTAVVVAPTATKGGLLLPHRNAGGRRAYPARRHARLRHARLRHTRG